MIKKASSILKKILPQNTFLRNVATLSTGTLFAQTLAILVSPVLTRLYAPEYFGIYSYYTSILGIISVIVCWRYEVAIVMPVEENEAVSLFFISIFICIIMSLLILVAVFFYNEQVASVLNTPLLAKWLLLLPFSVFIAGLFQTFTYWNTRNKQFKRLAFRQISQQSVTSTVQLGTGFIGMASPGSLIGASIAGQAGAAIGMGISIFRTNGILFKNSIKSLSIKTCIIRYRNFPLFGSPTALVNSASTLLPPLLFGLFWGPVMVGHYSLATRILALPMIFIGENIGKVFFPHANEASQNGSLNEITLDTFRKLLSVSVVPLALIFIVAPNLFPLFFGREWYISGIYAQWIVILMFFRFISSPISAIFPITEKQHISLVWNILFLSSKIIVIIICGYLYSSTLAIQLYGILGGIFYFVYLCFILSLAKVSIWRCIKLIFVQIIRALPFCTVPLLLSIILNDLLLITMSGILMGVIFLVFTLRPIISIKQ